MGPWKSALFYTLMRFFIFVFFFLGFLLFTQYVLKDDSWLWPLLAAALVSIAVSYVVLAGPRNEMAAGIERHAEERARKVQAERLADPHGQAAEDAEADAALAADGDGAGATRTEPRD